MKRPFRIEGQAILPVRGLSSRCQPASARIVCPTQLIQSLLLWILVLSASPTPACAQVTAAISGHVEDTSGAGVSGATVTVKNLETGAARVVNTDEAGDFRVFSLPLGPQDVK